MPLNLSLTGTMSDVVPLAKRFDRFTEADIDSEIVVMRLDNGEFFSLSETSAAIWRLIDGTRDCAALLSELVARFDADETMLAADLEEFLEQLRGMGLLGD